MSNYAEKVQKEREEKLNRLMPTLEEAFGLKRKVKEQLGPGFVVSVMSVTNQETGQESYYLDCIVKRHFNSEAEVGDNRMQITNEFMWNLIH